MCGHHILSAVDKIAENSFSQFNNQDYEIEADYFAATILSPFPLYEYLNVQSPLDVQNVFGLSAEASLYRYKEYLKWKQYHRKTAWENDIVKLYKQKGSY